MKKNKLVDMTPTRMTMWWFPASAVVIVVFGTLLVLLPKINQIMESRKKVESSRLMVNKLQTKATSLETMDMARTDRLYELVNIGLPSNKPFFEVIIQLQKVASDTEVGLGDFDLNPGSLATKEAKPNAAGQVAVSTALTVQGTYDNLVEFVNRLQKTLPLFLITGINFDTGANDSVRANMQLDVYYQPAPVLAKNTVDVPLPTLERSTEDALNILASYHKPALDVDLPPLVDQGREDIFNF
jgi:Tfp pilus assembly protein PilO